MISRRLSLIPFAAVLLLTTSCAGSLFKVKPVVELPPLAGDVKSANAGGVTVRVAPPLSDEDSQDLFEANLPLAGILPVRLELVFDSGVAVETKKVRFRLKDSEGREWKLVSPKAAVGRILKANDVYAYNVFLYPPEHYGQMIKDQFDTLYEEGNGGVMGIAIHPYLVNQPHRQKAFEDVIAYMRGFADVWWTRGVDIADWYYERHFDEVQKAVGA